jgi:NitT/TauT family transport system substrate-binding protein
MTGKKTTVLAAFVAALALTVAGVSPSAAQNNKISVAVPGVPPVFSTTIAFVAEKQGFFKKYGVDATVRPFDNGTAAARAVVAGDVDLSWSPTPPVINQVSNAGVPIVAVYGMPNPDWVLVSTQEGKSCKDIAGQPVGVDSIGGARSVALRSMLVGCPEVKLADVQQVALGSNSGAAMIAGRLNFAILHLDDLAALAVQGKKAHILLAMKNTNPTSHYLSLMVRMDNLAKKRDAIVGAVAAMVDAARFMNDPKNADAVAEAATVTGHSKEICKEALKEFLAIDFWATKDDGLPQKKIDAVAALMKKVGAIKPDKEPVKYADFVDQSVWKDAVAKVK